MNPLDKLDPIPPLGKKITPTPSPPAKPVEVRPGIWRNPDGKLETQIPVPSPPSSSPPTPWPTSATSPTAQPSSGAFPWRSACARSIART